MCRNFTGLKKLKTFTTRSSFSPKIPIRRRCQSIVSSKGQKPIDIYSLAVPAEDGCCTERRGVLAHLHPAEQDGKADGDRDLPVSRQQNIVDQVPRTGDADGISYQVHQKQHHDA